MSLPSRAQTPSLDALTLTQRAVVAAALLAVVACGTSAPASSSSAGAPVVLTANLIGTPVATLVVEVTAADIPNPLVFNLTVEDGIATGTLRLPPGSARTITVRAYDSNGDVTHEGSKTIDVELGINAAVSIPMVARAGQVPITVQIGAVSVVVQPATATLTVGETLQLTAVITAPNGDPLPGPASWATSNPAVATVDPSGLVSTLSGGTVDIVATYAGVAGVSHLTTIIPACLGCTGAVCDGTCVDLSPVLATQIQGALPTASCIPPTLVSPVLACSGQTCGGTAGCTATATWGSISLTPASGLISGSGQVTSDIDLLYLGSSCTVTATADFTFTGTVTFVCAEGSEGASVQAVTPTVTNTTTSGCGLLGALADFVAPFLTSYAESAVATALSETVGTATASCP